MRFPGEWEPHERTIMGWPCRASLWGETMAAARAEYAAVAHAIAAHEPVTMIANPGADADAARASLSGDIDVLELDIDDSWLRDSGPIYTVDPAARTRTAVHWGFNAWGGKFPPWDQDAVVGGLVATRLGDPVIHAPMILEGGAILSDGAGTILATEQTLLAPNRNPDMTRAQVEAMLADYLGAGRVVWLELGQYEDRDTDGHVDMIAAYGPGGRLLLQTAPPGDANHERGLENLARAIAAGIDVVEIPHLPRTTVAGEPVAVSYLNLYVCNGAVVVPVCGDARDEEMLAIIASVYPGRELHAIHAATIAFGGGGPHCITQQVPAL